jgi:hypothetical protein
MPVPSDCCMPALLRPDYAVHFEAILLLCNTHYAGIRVLSCNGLLPGCLAC